MWQTDERSWAAKLYWDNLLKTQPRFTFGHWSLKAFTSYGKNHWKGILQTRTEYKEGAANSWYFLHYMSITQSSYISGISLESIIILPLQMLVREPPVIPQSLQTIHSVCQNNLSDIASTSVSLVDCNRNRCQSDHLSETTTVQTSTTLAMVYLFMVCSQGLIIFNLGWQC